MVVSFGFAVLYLKAHRKIQMKYIHKKYQHYFHGDQESHHAGKAPGDAVWSLE